MRTYRPSEEFLTIRGAARAIGVDERTLRKWITFGWVKTVLVGPHQGPMRRIAASEVERLKKEQSS